MKKINQIHKSQRFWFTLAAMGVMAAVSSFSPATFGQAEFNKKKDVINTEDEAPKMVNHPVQASESGDVSALTYDNAGSTIVIRSSSPFSDEQKKLFLKLAKEAFIAQGIEPPANSYKVEFDMVTRNDVVTYVEISWYPQNYNGDQPAIYNLGKSYYMKFSNVEVEKGTGTMQMIEIFERTGRLAIGEKTKDLETGNLTPFIKAAKAALQAKQIKLPENGYEISSRTLIKRVAPDTFLKLLDIRWEPEIQRPTTRDQPINFSDGTIYHVQFSDVDLKNQTGTLEIVEANERRSDITSQPPMKVEKSTPITLTKRQAAPFIKMARDAFKAKQIELPQTGYWISSTGTYSKDNANFPKQVRICWYPDGVAEGTSFDSIQNRVFFADFAMADFEKGTGQLLGAVVIENGSVGTNP